MARLPESELWDLVVSLLPEHADDLSNRLSREANITRQTVNNYLNRWIAEGKIRRTGTHRKPGYQLTAMAPALRSFNLRLDKTQSEDTIYQQTIQPLLSELPNNVNEMIHYGFTEMVNNAIDHSDGSELNILWELDDQKATITIHDNGEGIFKRIQRLANLVDPRQALLKLSSGKFTTDPSRHTGQGIFFTSRMFDAFYILSGGVVFSHQDQDSHDSILEIDGLKATQGTIVHMSLDRHTSRTSKSVFDRFADDTDYSFNKTMIPIRMAQLSGSLVSRSEAKRLAVQFTGFKRVILDFKGVESIGQAFADEVFRVYQNMHPEVTITPLYAGTAVSQMIERALLEGPPKDPLA